jgi:CRP-like cAMP-binding protein
LRIWVQPLNLQKEKQILLFSLSSRSEIPPAIVPASFFASFLDFSPKTTLSMLATLLRQVPYFTSEDVDAFVPLWNKQVQVKRNDFLVRQGQVEQHLYFVLSGAFRLYYPTPQEDICVGFAYPNTLLTAFPSLVTQTPSTYCIQALKKSELLAISRTDFYALQEERPVFGTFWRHELEKALMGKMEREIDLQLLDPQQRLDRLLARSPHIFQLVPKKYIASYLRMTPETLSRLK